jgi:hypothetical protein
MKSVAVLLVFSLCFTAVVFPQDAPANALGWSALQSVPLQQELQVNLKNGKSVRGKLDSITDTSLALVNKKGVFSFQAGEVSEIYKLGGRRILKRTLIGAAIGTGAGGIIGYAAADEHDFLGRGVSAILGAFSGLVIGSVTGLFLGSSKKKELVYKANP